MEKPKITKEMYEKLKADFPAEAYSEHPTKTFLTVLKAMYITERLNEVFGVGRWEIETETMERTDSYILVKGNFISYDYDVRVTKQYGGHTTIGKGTEIADGYKSAVTDCQSKIASYLGIGIDMFKGKIKLNKTCSASSYSKPSSTPLANTSKCPDCGAAMRTSKAGKSYCSAICWEKPTVKKVPVKQATKEDFSDLPF